MSKKKGIIALIVTMVFVGVISVSAATYSLGRISNLSARVTKTSSDALTENGRLSLRAVKVSSSSSSSWVADLYSRSSAIGQKTELLATGNMNLNSTMTEYSITWNTSFSGGYKFMKATGTSGTVTFDASLSLR